MSQNPYSAPVGQVGQSGHVPANNRALAPGIILLILGSIWLIIAIVSVPINIMDQLARMEDVEVNEAGRIGRIIGLIIGSSIHFIAGIVAIVGGISMIRAKGYRTAMVSAVTACVPCLTPCFIVGIPFGIWAIVALMNPETKKAFEQNV